MNVFPPNYHIHTHTQVLWCYIFYVGSYDASYNIIGVLLTMKVQIQTWPNEEAMSNYLAVG